jgi:hypothetical protein
MRKTNAEVIKGLREEIEQLKLKIIELENRNEELENDAIDYIDKLDDLTS